MAVTPLPPDNTVRWYLKYTVSSFPHTLQMRSSAAATASNVCFQFDALLTALGPLLWLMPIIGLERSAAGSNVRLPMPTVGLEASYGSGTPPGYQLPWGMNFAGRSVTGRRSHVYVLNCKNTTDTNFVLTAVENTAVAAAVDVLNTADPDVWLGIDGTSVTYYARATVKQNDHVVGQLRGT